MDVNTNNIFHYASSGDATRLMYLLQHDSKLVFSRDQNDDMPIHLASSNNQLECLKVLLSFHAYGKQNYVIKNCLYFLLVF